MWFFVTAFSSVSVRTSRGSQPFSDTPEAACLQLFFLSSHVGRGNACSVAAVFKEIPCEGEDKNNSLTVCLHKMGKESKVRIFKIQTHLINF